MTDRLAAALELGTRVFAWLAVLTLVEFIIALSGPPLTLLWLSITALAKAALIARHYMHIGVLWGDHA